MKKLTPLFVLICLIAITAFGINKVSKKNTRLNHIAVYVKDLKVTSDFYRDIIGLDTIPEPFHDGKHTWFSIGDQSHLHLIAGAKAVTEHDKNAHLCFSVPSIEEFISGLDKASIPWESWIGESKKPTLRVDGVKQIYFKDPEGNWIEINNDFH
jgi:lactoylglutathione lyase